MLVASIGVNFVGIKEGRSLGPLGVVILGRFEGIIEDDSRVESILLWIMGRRKVGFTEL